ncbi:vitellogenin receptor Yl [Cherax quadricarinatus]|uniref:vitellogenin receptor Yl n=1 Tax=Cherax quadricarinatus TaxID=27406 RepID=UPI00387EB1BD
MQQQRCHQQQRCQSSTTTTLSVINNNNAVSHQQQRCQSSTTTTLSVNNNAVINNNNAVINNNNAVINNNNAVECSEDQVKCGSSGKCLPLSWLCDGAIDCDDGTDEVNCPKMKCVDQFSCTDSGRCVPVSWQCDGDLDCLDGSDESECPQDSVCRLQRGEFKCQNSSTCLNVKQVCNGSPDCSNGDDEGPACDNSCPEKECSHGCFTTPKGYQCTCPVNLTLDHFNTTCLGGLPSAYVLVGTRANLEAYSLDSASEFTVYSGKANTASGIIAVAYDPVEAMVYWSMKEQGGVYRKDLHAARHAELIIETDGKVVEGLAVDWLGRNLYMTDSQQGCVSVCSLRGIVCKTLVSSSSCRAIHLDLQNRKMFWTNWKIGVVESADLDGSSKSTLVSGLGWPNALAADPSQHKLYWMDALTNTVEHMNYDGTNRTSLVGAKIDHPFSMDLLGDQLYWSDWSTKQVWMCNKEDCATKTPVMMPLSNRPFGIKILHTALYMKIKNPCESHRCSHLCLLSASSLLGYTCACPTHLMLSDDHVTCVSASHT